MTRPTINPTISNGVVVRIPIFMVSLPTAYTRSASIALRKCRITTYCWMSMRHYPAFTPSTRDCPFRFNHDFRKCHFAPPLMRIIQLATWVSSGRIGVCGFLDSFGIQSDPLVNWNQPLVGGIFPILPFISYWVEEGVI